MPRDTDIRIAAASLFFLPLRTRVPLKFGSETTTQVTCARVRLTVRGQDGRTAVGWGETPLSVQWVWPSTEPYESRHEALKAFCVRLNDAWAHWETAGHAIEIGHAFLAQALPDLLGRFNASREGEPVPHLAALVCASAFDIALHDAYGVLHRRPVYDTYNDTYMSQDLAHFLQPAEGAQVTFAGRFPQDFLILPGARTLDAWHLVGGLDPLGPDDLDGSEPDDGHPVQLLDWIRRDGLVCLKIKLRGDDPAWDERRIAAVGRIALAHDVSALSLDFNCTVKEPATVNDVLDRLRKDEPRVFERILYVEQPFPYDLEAHRTDVRSVAQRKPLFMDESAHDWRLVRLGRGLGWTGVALKTCKTQSGALLALCWAKAHGMGLMVQDLTNPMLAMIPHALLAAHTGTLRGFETNGSQFYPDASAPEAAVHPGLFRRRNGQVDLASLKGPGFGYRLEEIRRELPPPAAQAQAER